MRYITDQMIEILRKRNAILFFLKGEWRNSLDGKKNFNNVRIRPFGYEEETVFPWNAKFSHSYMANEW